MKPKASFKHRSAAKTRDWTERFRASLGKLSTSPSHALAHEVYRHGRQAPETVDGFSTVRIGILRNATVEPWLPELFTALLQRGIKGDFRLGDYGVYEHYAANPKDLGGPDPDWFLVYVDSQTIAGDARHDPPDDLAESLVNRMLGIVRGLIDGTDAQVILSNLAPEANAVHRLHEDQNPCGWPRQRREVNLELVKNLSHESRVIILDMDRIVGEYGAMNAYDTRLHLTARSPFAVNFLPHLSRALANIVATATLPPKKCVVVDCDNTLWGGVLGEDGPEGVAIGTDYPGYAYREFQLFLAGLRRRGLLLAISSKNNERDVISFLETSPDMILRADDFAAYRINWRDKAANLEELAGELNIGLESMVFIDDSRFECARVRAALPDVQVDRFPADPAGIPGFQATLSGVDRLWVGRDDLLRADSLHANVQRERLRRETPDLESFLRSLDIELVIARQDRNAVARVSQLSQRTNQFTLTTTRYGIGDIERLMRDDTVYTMRMKDRFSDYGIIAAAIVTSDGKAVREIDAFMLSCRAFGRGIEDEFLAVLLGDAQAGGAKVLRASYIATPKNGMARDFYPRHGFDVAECTEEATRFEFGFDDQRPYTTRGHYAIRKEGFKE